MQLQLALLAHLGAGIGLGFGNLGVLGSGTAGVAQAPKATLESTKFKAREGEREETTPFQLFLDLK